MSSSDNTLSIHDSELGLADSHSAVPLAQKIEIRGDVCKPGTYSFIKEADIFHYLNQAGGSISDPSLCNLVVVRQYGDQKRSLLFRLDQKDYLPRVRQGDVIIISVLDEAKKNSRNFHKPTLVPSKQKTVIRPNAEDYENTLPSRGQSLKKSIGDYIRFAQFKRILNQIATHQAATGAKSIAVMSCEKSEGKSFFCSALALAYARFLNSQVLVIDSNKDEALRSPYLAVVRGDYSSQLISKSIQQESAFIDLTSVSDIERDFHEHSDFYFSPYINSVKSNYDLVLVDTGATNKVANHEIDPMIIAAQVDAVIVIQSPLSLDKQTIEKFSKDLRKSGAQILGTIYNPIVAK